MTEATPTARIRSRRTAVVIVAGQPQNATRMTAARSRLLWEGNNRIYWSNQLPESRQTAETIEAGRLQDASRMRATRSGEPQNSTAAGRL